MKPSTWSFPAQDQMHMLMSQAHEAHPEHNLILCVMCEHSCLLWIKVDVLNNTTDEFERLWDTIIITGSHSSW